MKTNKETKQSLGPKIGFGVAVLLALLMIINAIIGSIIAADVEEELKTYISNIEEVELVQSNISVNPLLGRINGNELIFDVAEDRIEINDASAKLGLTNMLALKDSEDLAETMLNFDDSVFTLNKTNLINQQDEIVSTLEQLRLTYASQADLDNEEWSFKAGIGMEQSKVDLKTLFDLSATEAQEISQMFNLDLSEVGFNHFNLAVSSDDFFKAPEYFELVKAERENVRHFVIDNLEFNNNLMDVNSWFDMAYSTSYDEFGIFDSEVRIEILNEELRETVDYLAFMMGINFEYDNGQLVLSPHGPLNNLSW
ncbi:hypothetical protein [Fuchsiella alkaliacetigena]|uniref:hypothetical protein n=1 Tax=Fuchsiella alkaliacetigena TaxID=957042 RepID=UPI00200A01AB|nr:hypothetical protein [Fuchsiella alkaliacetigena]MCK8825959.1 hypothetical protein [Fuchsiella alkaliacetigena]